MTPQCTHTRHSWKRGPGGLKENPGVWSIGGNALSFTETCQHCGMSREKVVGDVSDWGNRNHGWRYTERMQADQ